MSIVHGLKSTQQALHTACEECQFELRNSKVFDMKLSKVKKCDTKMKLNGAMLELFMKKRENLKLFLYGGCFGPQFNTNG